MQAAKEIQMFNVDRVKENKEKGFVPVYRSIRDHWIWQDSVVKTRFEAWIDLLLSASHDDQKEPVGYDLIVVKKGQVLTSQLLLSKRWRWDRGTVRGFLSLLQKDKMISIKPTNKFTMITICNYDAYKNLRPTKQQQVNNKSTTSQHIQPLEPLKEDSTGAWRKTHKGFFERQYEANKSEPLAGEYLELIEFLHGKNKTNLYFANVLSLERQISYKDFVSLKEAAKESSKTIGQVLVSMENTAKLKSKYKNVFLTANNWLKNDFGKK